MEFHAKSVIRKKKSILVKSVPVGTISPWNIPAETPSKKKVVHVVAAVKPMICTPSCEIPLVGQPIGDPFAHDPYHSRLIHLKIGSGRAVSTHREKRSRSLLKKIAAPRQTPITKDLSSWESLQPLSCKMPLGADNQMGN